jgi:hypothetical protein
MRLQDDAASDGAPIFTDQKHRIIIFPQLEPEDWQVFKVQVRQRVPYFPDHFLETWTFGKDVEVEDAQVEISMPAGHSLFIDRQGFAAGRLNEKVTVSATAGAIAAAPCRT